MAKNKQFLVAGLGMFGSAVALAFSEMGYNILGVDANENVVQDLSDKLTDIVCADASDEKTLQAMALDDIDVAVVAIGNLEKNMLCTMLLKQMGIKTVVAKAINELHGRMLEKIGADKVVFAEKDMGIRLAHNLVSDSIIDYIELSEDINVVSVTIPKRYVGLNLVESDLRNKYNVNVIAIRRNGKSIINPKADEVFAEGDQIVTIGAPDNIKFFGDNF